MSKPIIATVDPRREDLAPAALGALLARLTGAPLVLAGAYAVDRSVDNLYPDYARALSLDAERAVCRVAAKADAARVRVTTTTVPAGDSLAYALHELAERSDAKLLVIGASRRGPIGRLLLSAVTDRLLHGAPCPVAVARCGFSFADAVAGPGLIGVAFTDTPGGYAALDMARALAGPGRTRVRVLTVGERPAAEIALRRGIEALPSALSAGGEILSGDPVDALAAASAHLGLLVCGSRGYGPARTLLVGGTSHALVREAACPVLVVPPAATDDDPGPARADRPTVTA